MTWVMTIAAGAALGYFLFQYMTKNARSGQEAEETDTETFRAEEAAEETEEAAERRTGKIRLHRSRTDRKVAGVCGGIAEYLNADPSIVRLVTIVLMFGWGSGLLAYLICALVLPEE